MILITLGVEGVKVSYCSFPRVIKVPTLFSTEFTGGEVQLLVEAFRLPKDPLLDGDKVGHALFTVYPRTTSVFPPVKAHTPPADEETEVYSFDAQLTLTQTLSGEGISVSAAVLEVSVALMIKPGNAPEDSPQKPAKSKSQERPIWGQPVSLCDFKWVAILLDYRSLLSNAGESETKANDSSDRFTELRGTMAVEGTDNNVHVDGGLTQGEAFVERHDNAEHSQLPHAYPGPEEFDKCCLEWSSWQLQKKFSEDIGSQINDSGMELLIRERCYWLWEDDRGLV